MTGDLSNASQKGARAFGLDASRDNMSFARDLSTVIEDDGMGFTDPFGLMSPSKDNRDITSDTPVAKAKEVPQPQVDFIDHGQINLAKLSNFSELDFEAKNFDFRRLFKLSFLESINEEEENVTLFDTASNMSLTGTMFLSNLGLHYVSSQTPIAATQKATNALVTPTVSFSSAIDVEPNFILNLKYSDIESLKRQAAMNLSAIAEKGISLSGYLVITTKPLKEIWMSFSSVKIRDKIYESLLPYARRPGDVIVEESFHVGSRNQSMPPETKDSPALSSKRISSFMADPDQISDLLIKTATLNIQVGDDRIPVFQVPLEYMFPRAPVNRNNVVETKRTDLWASYFTDNGDSVTHVKNLKSLRNLIYSTCGVPSKYRGDFW